MKLQSAIPILRMFSEEKAREFYIDFLGFTVDWEHRFEPGLPLYMQIRRDHTVLHLSEHYGDSTPGSAVFVPIISVDEFHAELMSKDNKYQHPGIDDHDWGRAVNLTDPFGNRLRVTELKIA